MNTGGPDNDPSVNEAAEAEADAQAEADLGAGESAQGTDAGANTGPGMSAGQGQEADEGDDRDLSMDDTIDYSPYDDSDLDAMQKDFTERQNALPVTQRHNAHAIRSELRALTENVRSKDPATIFGINYSKDRHTQQEKQAMVQSFMDKHGKAIDDMAKDHNAEMNAKGKKGGVIGGAMSAMQSPAGMLLLLTWLILLEGS